MKEQRRIVLFLFTVIAFDTRINIRSCNVNKPLVIIDRTTIIITMDLIPLNYYQVLQLR